MLARDGFRHVVLAATLGVSTLAGLPLGLAQQPAAEPPERHYLFFEAEKVFTNREQWLTQNWNNPSGGEWIYGNVDRGSPTGEVRLPGDGPWFVWMRLWDWDPVDRRAYLEVNGEESYVCGGGRSSQWIWYHTNVGDGSILALRLTGVDAMDAWVDCLAVTDDPSWVPPHEMVSGGAYVSDGPYERLCRKPALIQPRGAGDDVPLSFYRRSFLLAAGADVLDARIRVGATGYWVVYLNGEEIGHDTGGPEPVTLDLNPALVEGANALCIQLEGDEPQPGVWVDGGIRTRDGWILSLCSNPAWHSALDAGKDWLEPDFDDRAWTGCWAREKQKPF
jgi:hypothetical protein